MKQKLPNATAVLVLGILSILACCCYGVPGLILGIVAVILAAKDMKLYFANPENYSDYRNLNIGRILAIIGIILSSIYFIVMVYLWVFVGQKGIQEWQQHLMDRIKYDQQQ